jgi:hypothetical protein
MVFAVVNRWRQLYPWQGCPRIAHVRADFMHKLTTRLCRENQAVVIEDLNVKGMPANERRARAISDVGFWDLSPLDAPLRRAEVFPRRIRFDLRRQVPGRAAAGRQAQMNVARPRGSYIEWRQRVGYGSSGERGAAGLSTDLELPCSATTGPSPMHEQRPLPRDEPPFIA